MRNLRRNLEQHFAQIECEFSLDICKAKSAYRKCALKAHPDKGGTKEAFLKLQLSIDKIAMCLTYFLKKYPVTAR